MFDGGFLTRFIHQNNLKDTLAKPMMQLIQNTLDKNRAWLRVQEKYK